MLCELRCLNESVEYLQAWAMDVIKVTEYKHHTTLVADINYGYSEVILQNCKYPLSICYQNLNTTTKLLDNAFVFKRKTVADKPKCINWGQQSERLKVYTLLKITG